MGERVDAAKEATTQRVEAAEEATGERVEAVKQAASELRRRSSRSCAASSTSTPSRSRCRRRDPRDRRLGRPRAARLGIYAVSLSALLGTSALYHRVNWKRPSTRRWMRRLDHSMIFLLIAGTLTPFALLVLEAASRPPC